MVTSLDEDLTFLAVAVGFSSTLALLGTLAFFLAGAGAFLAGEVFFAGAALRRAEARTILKQ
jgi:hypothetical protein